MSHAVAQLLIRQEDYTRGHAVVTAVTFVDLAGSERNRTNRGVGILEACMCHSAPRVVDALVATATTNLAPATPPQSPSHTGKVCPYQRAQ